MTGAARFSITVDGYEVASFAELQGITTTVTPIEFLKSSDQTILQKSPSTRTPPTVTLKHGRATSMELWAWHEAALMGNMSAARRSASLAVYAYERDPVLRYNLEQAWPSKLEMGGLKAGTTELMMESITIAYEFMERVK
jgi:phage tail-like protein